MRGIKNRNERENITTDIMDIQNMIKTTTIKGCTPNWTTRINR